MNEESPPRPKHDWGAYIIELIPDCLKKRIDGFTPKDHLKRIKNLPWSKCNDESTWESYSTELGMLWSGCAQTNVRGQSNLMTYKHIKSEIVNNLAQVIKNFTLTKF